MTPVVFRLERTFPLGQGQWQRHAALLAVIGSPLVYFATVLDSILEGVVRFALRQPALTPWFQWRFAPRDLVIPAALYSSTLAASFLIRHFINAQEKERLAAQLALENSQLESTLRRAELETLRMRLNPHFLFNCLQNVSALSQRDPRMASQMLAKLGDLLRVYLRPDYQAELPLEEEIELTRAYASIERLRYGARLSVCFEVESGTERALVPSLLLQPLVENAIKHGLQGQANKPGLIRVHSTRQANELVVTVSDNGRGLRTNLRSDGHLGIGLSSTCERLTRLYGSQHTFAIHDRPEGGTEVRITLPISCAEARSRERILYEQAAPVDRG